jgi:tRNA nucleotidyltransferase (CCA-adding enzyme)
MIDLGDIPPHLKSQLDEITTILKPFTKRAYLVGGCVRDLHLQKPIKDIDIEIYDISCEKFDALMQSIGALGVGKSFYVYKYKDLDLALPRVERKTGLGHKAFSVTLCQDEKEASQRRDFCMNSIMLNIFDFTVYDFWHGVKDIENKRIRLIDEQSFKEDSLRVLRAVQFAARFDFSIDAHTLHVMRQIDLSDLSKTRIFWELEKFFNATSLHVGFKYLYELGIFEKIFGLHVSFEAYEKVTIEIKKARFLEHLREYYFLYILMSVLKIKPSEIFKNIEVPNRYISIFKYQPYFDNIPSDYELYIIAMQKPLKDWLGNYDVQIIKRAKELGIYEEIYTGGIDIQDVINDGFTKAEIKKEYTRRLLESIRERLDT